MTTDRDGQVGETYRLSTPLSSLRPRLARTELPSVTRRIVSSRCVRRYRDACHQRFAVLENFLAICH